MYQPAAFREDRLQVQHDLIRAHPLGILVTAAPSSDTPDQDAGLAADHVPFLLLSEVAAPPTTGPAPSLGILRGHVARANPVVQRDGAPCLVVFQGPAAYVTPAWYASKREHGRVVPTWNYAVVHAHGRLRVVEDAGWLHDQIAALTERQESSRAQPWAPEDAPADFIAAQMRGIVGIEIAIARLEGKWKVSQNRPEPDRAGVVAGLATESAPSATAMAHLVATRTP